MKKLIAGLFTAVLMTSALAMVSETTPAAHAAPYVNSVNTATTVKGPKKVKKGKKVVVRALVSNAAKGTVTVTIRRGKTVVKKVTVQPGTAVRFKAKKPGKYKITAVYTPAKNTPWKSSSSQVKVVRVK